MEKTTNLRQLRKKRKLTAQRLSEETMVPVKVIYELERGLTRADIKCVLTLAEYFGISIECLMGTYEGGEQQ